MKILLLAKVPAYYELFRQPNQSFPQLQAQTHWLKAIKSLGHQVKVFRYSDNLVLPQKLTAKLSLQFQQIFPGLYHYYRLIKNRFYCFFPDNLIRSIKLDQLIKSFKPDCLIIAGGISELLSFPLKSAQKKGIKIYLLHGENPKISATQFEKNNLNIFDWIIVNDPIHAQNWQQLGAQHTKALPYAAIDSSCFKKLKCKKDFDVVFIGTLSKDRQAILSKLTQFNLAVFGYLPSGLNLNPKLKPFYQGEAWGKDMVKIYNRAKIGLNLVPQHMPVGGNLRTFEIPGCAALQIANRCPKNWFKPNQEIVLFNSVDDLKQKINYYLNHTNQRNKIAEAGYKTTHQLHTYKHRFKQILCLNH